MALPKVETLEKMALQVDQELRLHGYSAAFDCIHNVVLPARRNSSGLLQSYTNVKILSLFEAVCEKMNLFSSLVVATLANFSVRKAVMNPSFLGWLRMVDKKAAERLLEYAMIAKNWKLFSEVLQSKPSLQFLSVLTTLVQRFHSVPAAVRHTQVLLLRGFIKKSLLVSFMGTFIKVGNKRLFEFVVQKDLISLMEITDTQSEKDVVDSVLSMIMKATEELEERAGKELNNMLAIAIGTGVSTFHAALIIQHTPEHVESPLLIAALNGHMKIVRLLYRSGATTNRELFEFKEFMPYSGMEEEWDSDDIYRYLRCASQQPRRLKELCFLRISHMAGCRSMEARAKILNKMPLLTTDDPGQTSDGIVSFTLKDRVLFKDVLFDFNCGTLHRAKCRDPPGFW